MPRNRTAVPLPSGSKMIAGRLFRRCLRCGRVPYDKDLWIPLTDLNFAPSSDDPLGYSRRCRDCETGRRLAV